MPGQGLADLLSGAAGAPVNRPQLNAFVANSQATNGLRSAQTEDALLSAQRAQDEQTASGELEDAFLRAGARPADAHLMAVSSRLHAGSAINAMDMYKAYNASVLGDPSKLGQPDQTAAAQAISGKLEPFTAAPSNFVVNPGQNPGPVQQTPLAAAQTAATQSLGDLHQTQADAGGFRSQQSQFGTTSPEGIAALTKAVSEGRLDPTRLNSRTAPMLSQIELQAPGTNFNRLHADAALQSNPTFQQRAQGLEIMPGILQHLTTLGKALDDGAGYSDVRTVGKVQQFMNGEFNDPAYAEYMPVRNDAILRLAYLMRGQGASNQAATMEHEAFTPTLAPYALDAWLKGQMSVLKPMIDRNNKIAHLGEPGQGTQPLSAAPAADATSPAAPSLRDSIPGATPPNLPAYASEADALAAGHKAGDRVIIGGHPGTLY